MVDIDGDASFAMTLTELSTAAENNVGVKILILNNEFQVNMFSSSAALQSLFH